MGRSHSLSKAKEFISAQGGHIAPLGISEEELNPDEQDDMSYQAYPLESMESCYRVNFNFPEDSLCSEFGFFEDGKQRTIQIGYIPVEYGDSHVLIPVHYFVVSSVILQRNSQELKVWQSAKVKEGVFVEKSLIPNQKLFDDFIEQGLEIIDIHAQGGDYYALRKKTLQEAKKLRLQLETDLIAEWRLSDDSKKQLPGC